MRATDDQMDAVAAGARNNDDRQTDRETHGLSRGRPNGSVIACGPRTTLLLLIPTHMNTRLGGEAATRTIFYAGELCDVFDV